MKVLTVQIILGIVLTINIGMAQSTWKSIGPGEVDIYSFAVNDSFLFAGGSINEGGVQRTADEGNEWTEVNHGLPPGFSRISALLSTDTAEYAFVTYQLFISRDSGNDWDLVNVQVSGQSANVMDYAGAPWNIMYVGGSSLGGNPSVMVSPDGSAWSKLNTGLPSMGGVYSMIQHDSSLYAGTFPGVFRLDYNTSTWVPSRAGLGQYEIFSLAKNDQYFFAGTRYNGVFRSPDGKNWSRIQNGLDTMQTPFNAFAIVGSEVYVAASGKNGGVYKTSDQGENWTLFNTGFPEEIEVYALKYNPPYLVAGTRDHGVYILDSLIISAVEKIQETQALLVVPNPNDGTFTIQVNLQEEGIFNLTLTDQFGKLVFSRKVETTNGTAIIPVQTPTLSSGIYFLRLSGNGIEASAKVLIR